MGEPQRPGRPESTFADLEAETQAVVTRVFEARAVDIAELGVRLEVDPVARRGEGPAYESYVEATLYLADGEPHDVIFFYIVQRGRPVITPSEVATWLDQTITGSLAEARDR